MRKLPQSQDEEGEGVESGIPPHASERAVGKPPQLQDQGGEQSSDIHEDGQQDRWELRSLCLVRIHVQPRRQLFAPDRCEDPLPIPLNHLDVIRVTKTSLETADEQNIEDIWDGSEHDCRELSAP